MPVIRTTVSAWQIVWLVLLIGTGPGAALCQEATPQDIVIPVIADEPRGIDPATLVPAQLAQRMTVEFSQASLSEVGDWIEKNAKIPVLFDQSALEVAGLSLSEPVSDRLNDDSLYLLLNRLQTLGLAWYVKDNVVRVTTTDAASTHTVTIPYTMGDLLDRDFETGRLLDVMTFSLGGLWFDVDGEGGSIEFLGDVLFVRQTDSLHLRLKGLLSALRKHGRQTFVFDPPQHQALRAKLLENVTVNFDDVPLVEAVADLARQSATDIRLDAAELRKIRIRDRQPVSLVLAERQLQTVLEVMLAELKLTWMLRDGVLWVTSQDRAAEEQLTAVYDVRDLCRDDGEAAALENAIMSQTGDLWVDLDGDGGSVQFATPGTLVVCHTDPAHGRVLRLLDAYRSALKASKPRENRKDPDAEILTRFYVMQTSVAGDLLTYIRQSVAPASWKSEQTPNASGTVNAVLSGGKGVLSGTSDTKVAGSGVVADRAVVVITQTRANHREIAAILQRIQNGDERPLDPLQDGGLGGGGFGGGYFSIEPPGADEE